MIGLGKLINFPRFNPIFVSTESFIATSLYCEGGGYAKHSDVLQGKKNRILTTVLYLNEDWQAADGGELVVFEATGNTVIATVNPTFGTMIIFLSGLFPHEVLISQVTRRSIAGWFRVSTS